MIDEIKSLELRLERLGDRTRILLFASLLLDELCELEGNGECHIA